MFIGLDVHKATISVAAAKDVRGGAGNSPPIAYRALDFLLTQRQDDDAQPPVSPAQVGAHRADHRRFGHIGLETSS